MAPIQAREPFACLLVVLATFILYKLLAPSKHRATSPSVARPRGLPIIGHLHQIGALPHASLAALAARHGAPLMLLRLGSVPTLVVSSAEALRAVFQPNDRALSGRPPLYASRRITYGLRDIVFGRPDAVWRACQSGILGAPRVRGFRAVRKGEAAALVAAVARAAAPVDLSRLLLSSSNRVVRRVAFGGDGEGRIEAAILGETQSLLGGFFVADYLPWLGWVDALSGMRRRLERNCQELDAFYESVIEDHLSKRTSSSSSDDEEEDFVDVLLRLHRDPAHRSAFGSRNQIKGILTDMFIAGTDTSAAALEWTMTELVNNPAVLAKAQHEVRSVVGGDRDMVREPDLAKLEYLKLVIKESLRLHPPGPLLVPRETTEPFTVHGCEIPARTRVLVNAKAIGADPAAWGPECPTRRGSFPSGTTAAELDGFALVPFGIGRRICPGAAFATAVVELLLANLLFSFDWRAPLGEVDVEEDIGMTSHRKHPLMLVAERRGVR